MSLDESRDLTIAMIIDFENLALGFQNRKGHFQIRLVLDRIVEKGKIIVKRAYADWSRYSDYKKELHEHAIELIEVPRRAMTGKNSADIRLVVDAMDLCYAKEHINTFVIVSGDSDFSPLVSKLKENGKHVIGLGMKDSTSNLLSSNCDEFIFYEDLERVKEKHQVRSRRRKPPVAKDAAAKDAAPKDKDTGDKEDAFDFLCESIEALVREDKDIIWGSMVKQTMKRKRPEFNESYFGFASFSELLEEAAEKDIVHIKKDARSGTYVVTGFGENRL